MALTFYIMCRELERMRRSSVFLSIDYYVVYYRDVISQKYKNENVNITIRSREADESEQVEYLHSSVVRKLSKV